MRAAPRRAAWKRGARPGAARRPSPLAQSTEGGPLSGTERRRQHAAESWPARNVASGVVYAALALCPLPTHSVCECVPASSPGP
eukprot:gene36602-54946_t